MYSIKQVLMILTLALFSCNTSLSQGDKAQQTDKNTTTMSWKTLTPEEKYVIIDKGTERPFTGKFLTNKDEGNYVCKQCGQELYTSNSKFDSHCGWPSFDDAIEGAVQRIPDADGRRTEIVCSNCGGHLGHVFEGEQYTDKNTRHCVNSVSIDFQPAGADRYDTVYFASGCFWGTEYMFQDQKGVVSTRVGYIGGTVDRPTYEAVCTGRTGHAEAIELVFDPTVVSYRDLAKRFFETHDPTQIDRQGPDIGEQYRTEIFYTNEEQKQIAEELMDTLLRKGISVVTKLTPAGEFWDGESYHQNYYKRKGSKPYCHFYQKRF